MPGADICDSINSGPSATCERCSVGNGRLAPGAIRLLRRVALAEGVSYLLLLGVAMPLKYWAGWPVAVQWTGAIHGGLFLLYVAAVVVVAVLRRWPARRWIVNLAASVFPFGPFVVDARLRREEQALRDALAGSDQREPG